jgi:hypothetical protein
MWLQFERYLEGLYIFIYSIQEGAVREDIIFLDVSLRRLPNSEDEERFTIRRAIPVGDYSTPLLDFEFHMKEIARMLELYLFHMISAPIAESEPSRPPQGADSQSVETVDTKNRAASRETEVITWQEFLDMFQDN